MSHVYELESVDRFESESFFLRQTQFQTILLSFSVASWLRLISKEIPLDVREEWSSLA